MNLTALTAGKVSSTGTVTLAGQHGAGGTIGGVLITTDGSNAAVVVLKEDDTNGTILFDISTKSPMFVVGPIRSGNTASIYYSITGTGASAMLYEWND